MRAGLSTIQQTLTPEAASVLNQSIAEAGRRNHGQTTPLHVAATLLASPTGFLRQACIKSHPNSSHPLQCRALELCFSVALERLPTAQNMSPGMDPPISNALMAALKRAQAHQRRGCPEQQQQPLLAVKVELEQLIISILDDPSVSRVMREASFSSPAVKATIEQSLNSSGSAANSSPVGLGFRPTAVASAGPPRNIYLNPRLQQGNAAQPWQQKADEVKRVIDILTRTKKRNPVLVGESEPEAVVKELFRRIEHDELGDGLLKNIQIIHLEKGFASDRAQIPSKIQELSCRVETRIENSNVIIDLGDLKWLVEQPSNLGPPASGMTPLQVVSDAGRVAVAEMGKLLSRFGESVGRQLRLIGTATCETYLRCQVYHPSMENDWDLQAVPIAARAPFTGLLPRQTPHGILSSSVESLSQLKGFPPTTVASVRLPSENLDSSQTTTCCSQCTKSFEQELAKVLSTESEKSSSGDTPEKARPSLPHWLQNAKANDSDPKSADQEQTKEQELTCNQKTQELRKKWNDTCLRLHPNFHRKNDRVVPIAPAIASLYNPLLLARQPCQPKPHLSRSYGETLQLNATPMTRPPPERAVSPPRSPVRTEWVLGQTKINQMVPEQTCKEQVRDFLGRLSSEQRMSCENHSKYLKPLDADSFKELLKGLTEKVWWQQDAASAVARTVTECKLDDGERGAVSKGVVWLFFIGPDRVGKRKMAMALSELVFGSDPVIISLGLRQNDRESDVRFRGKTSLDRISEAVRQNPFSVIMLEDMDEADTLLSGSIKRAMERGRLTDSYGREISLGKVIFVMTAAWLPSNLKSMAANCNSLDEDKLASLAAGGWQLRLSTSEKTAKRRASWLEEEDRSSTKARKETGSTFGFDLNEAADGEDDGADGSLNSSDLTISHECDHGSLSSRQSASTASHELVDRADDAIVFNPVDFGPIKSSFMNSITKRFSSILGETASIEIQDDAAEKILAGVWLGKTGLEEWIQNALVPSFHQLKPCLLNAPTDSTIIRLELDGESGRRSPRDCLPSSVKVVAEAGGCL